jgi:hypothetical protein
MVLRFLLLVVLVMVLARFLSRLAGIAAAAWREGSSAPPRTVALVPCRRCGVFVPREQASAAPVDGFLCRSCAGA